MLSQLPSFLPLEQQPFCASENISREKGVGEVAYNPKSISLSLRVPFVRTRMFAGLTGLQ